MSKNTSNMFYLGIFLCIVCAFAAAIMGYAAIMTQKPIEKAKVRKVAQGLRQILPDFDNDPMAETHTFADQTDKNQKILFYTARKNGKITGFAAKVSVNSGYGGNVDGLISFHPDGSIRTFIITGHAETPGLGSNAMDRQEEKTLVSLFRKETKRSGLPPNKILDQYNGHSAGTSDSWKKPWKLTKDGGQAEYISGATISSKAVNQLAWKAASTFEANRQALTGKIQEVSK